MILISVMSLLLRCSIFCILLCAVAAQMQCKDMNNNNVDWYIFYKLPENKYSDDPIIKNGTAFIYLDVNNKQWVRPANVTIMDANQAVAYTLQQTYDKKQQQDTSVLNIFYNDEHPDNVTSFDAGHTKGVVSFDSTSGYWLIHSAPKFPPADHYFYPPNAHYFGQMGICISLGQSSVGDVATQLYFTRPFIYQFDLPDAFATAYPPLRAVKNGEYQTVAPFTSMKILETLGVNHFIHFAKAQGFNNDLYYNFISPSLSTSLLTETWQHEPGNIGSWCGTRQVNDITYLTLPFGVKFSNWYDHSKFAVAFNPGPSEITPPPFVCVGDINRQQHQLVRGGGSLCFRDEDLHKVYFSMAAEYNKTCVQKDTLTRESMLKENRVTLM